MPSVLNGDPGACYCSTSGLGSKSQTCRPEEVKLDPNPHAVLRLELASKLCTLMNESCGPRSKDPLLKFTTEGAPRRREMEEIELKGDAIIHTGWYAHAYQRTNQMHTVIEWLVNQLSPPESVHLYEL